MGYSAVLFLHLLAVGVAFGAATLIHWSLVRLRAATRAVEARDALFLCARTSRAMPLIALALFATGAGLTHARWGWTRPWVEVSIIGLVLMLGIGGTILRPRLMRAAGALSGAGDGAVSEGVAASLRDPVLWIVAHLPPALAIGIMFVMVTKPGAVGGVAALLGAAAAGASWAVLQRTPAGIAVPAVAEAAAPAVAADGEG